jgi:hypothetical protein
VPPMTKTAASSRATGITCQAAARGRMRAALLSSASRRARQKTQTACPSCNTPLWPVTFRPTECLMAPASCVPRTVGPRTRPWSLKVAPGGTEVLLSSLAPAREGRGAMRRGQRPADPTGESASATWVTKRPCGSVVGRLLDTFRKDASVVSALQHSRNVGRFAIARARRESTRPDHVGRQR